MLFKRFSTPFGPGSGRFRLAKVTAALAEAEPAKEERAAKAGQLEMGSRELRSCLEAI